MPIKKDKHILTVSQLNEYVKMMIDNSPVLNNVYISGEISNFKLHFSSGHIYFTLKDAFSSVKAVMFRSSAEKLKFTPEDGMQVIVSGRVSTYVRDGVYQIYASTITPQGIGEVALSFEQLKEKLSQEGLFDPSHKLSLPKYPNVIGVITSATGAAIKDIINIASRRFPSAQILIYPALVQGEGAEESLISGIRYFSENPCADVIIIGRGGGSYEDLQAFNSEKLARAIYSCPIPTISAVGHEQDYSISDFVADMRAPTPSAAAEICLPDKDELKEELIFKRNLLCKEIQKKITNKRGAISQISTSPMFKLYGTFIEDKRIYIDALEKSLKHNIGMIIQAKRSQLSKSSGGLNAHSPLAVFAKGYAKVSKEENIITNIDQLNVGDHVDLIFLNGKASAEIVKIGE